MVAQTMVSFVAFSAAFHCDPGDPERSSVPYSPVRAPQPGHPRSQDLGCESFAQLVGDFSRPVPNATGRDEMEFLQISHGLIDVSPNQWFAYVSVYKVS